jgi:hypothetical protein
MHYYKNTSYRVMYGYAKTTNFMLRLLILLVYANVLRIGEAQFIFLTIKEGLIIFMIEEIVVWLGSSLRFLYYTIVGKPCSFVQFRKTEKEYILNKVCGYICLTTLGMIIALW